MTEKKTPETAQTNEKLTDEPAIKKSTDDQSVTSSAQQVEKSSSGSAQPSSTQKSSRRSNNQQRTPTPVQNKISKTGLLALLLSIIAIAGIGGHYYWQTQQHQALINQVLKQNQDLQRESEQQMLKQLANNQQQLSSELTANISQLLSDSDGKILTLEDKVDSLSQNQPSDWLMHEAEYLIRVASRSLWLEKDTRAAINLLIEADTRLKELNDPSLLPVRQLINQDIEHLRLQPTLETEETILTLMAMAEQINQLPIAMAHLPDSAEPESNFELSENADDWQENLAKSWQRFLSSFITVKRRTANVEALLTPQQQENLRSNLNLKLQLAQWAASQHKDTLFKRTLLESQDWITTYFDIDHSAVSRFSQQLHELDSAVVSVQLPAQLLSLKAIRSVLEQDNTRLNKTRIETNTDVVPQPEQTKEQLEKETTPPEQATQKEESNSIDIENEDDGALL